MTQSSDFITRHIGPNQTDTATMLKALGYDSLEAFISKVVPASIRSKTPLVLSDFEEALSEEEALARLEGYASKNTTAKSYLGLGYYNCFTPTVIQRNILENPGWYTQYTPYQPEISQGRLEALLNYQTMVTDLTGLDIANASLLDEGTAAAEAMSMSLSVWGKDNDASKNGTFLVADNCHPQTIAIVTARAAALGVRTQVLPAKDFELHDQVFGVLIQYPGTKGEILDYAGLCNSVHAVGALVIVATDLLALMLLQPPGAFGADIAVGNSQRFGVPLGFGGPHAAFFATKDAYKRQMPGRLVGVTRDAQGGQALRLALQTREQHIRRERATSNICTAQVLLANMAGMYAVYHGPKRLREIAERVRTRALQFAAAAKAASFAVANELFFDTVELVTAKAAEIAAKAEKAGVLIRAEKDSVIVSFDETTTEDDVRALLEVITGKPQKIGAVSSPIPAPLARTSETLAHPVFRKYHSETEFLRYVRRLEAKDLSLGTAMIPLGSCTMKLNATSEMVPVTWKAFGAIHPFAPKHHSEGYRKMFTELERALAEITGFHGVSLQPNAGSQGEYAGLLAIHAYHASRKEGHRRVCLIPKSAHGTNPASAVMAGLRVVVVECDDQGNVDLEDLKKKADEHKENLSCLMVTYPSTHGVFEERIQEICKIVHERGGQVYMDGANLNALVGLVKPDEMGADLCHINLHKTFCIPHGGGGPGMGPIAVRKHLTPFLPKHPLVELGHEQGVGPVSAAPWGSASILPIPWMYIAMMAGSGLTEATKIAILSANYIAKRLEDHYPVLYRGANGNVAHECILDLRNLKATSGVEVEDVAKRLMDYGFHAPTISFPVPGTMMVEPTESESIEEVDRFCEAMIMIRDEIREIEAGKLDRLNNPLKNAPHTGPTVAADGWDRPYSRERAAFPTAWTKASKFWPAVGRVDGSYGDKNLVCACPPLESYS